MLALSILVRRQNIASVPLLPEIPKREKLGVLVGSSWTRPSPKGKIWKCGANDERTCML